MFQCTTTVHLKGLILYLSYSTVHMSTAFFKQVLKASLRVLQTEFNQIHDNGGESKTGVGSQPPN